MTPFPFPWRRRSVVVAIWILMGDTVHRPAACSQPHSFVYVEKHIKVNYYWEWAKSNMWCERRKGGRGASSFPFQRHLALNVFLKLLIKSAFYDVIGRPRRPGLSSPEVRDMKVDRVTYHPGQHNFTQLHQTMLRDKRSCSCMHCICRPGLLSFCCCWMQIGRKQWGLHSSFCYSENSKY